MIVINKTYFLAHFKLWESLLIDLFCIFEILGFKLLLELFEELADAEKSESSQLLFLFLLKELTFLIALNLDVTIET